MDNVSLYKLSHFYNQKRDLSKEFWESFIEEVNNLLGVGKKRWLDLGCGSGRTVLPLAGYFPNIWFLGIDVSLDMLSQIRKSTNDQAGLENVAILQADLNNSVPIKDHRFDCICLFQTIHYFSMDVIYDAILRFVSEGTLLIVSSTTHEQYRELPYCAYPPILKFEIARTPDFDKIEKESKAKGFKLIYSKDFTIHKKLEDHNRIESYLRTLPYSAFCVLDKDSLEEAIKETLNTVNENSTEIEFKVDAFKLSVFRYKSDKKNTMKI